MRLTCIIAACCALISVACGDDTGKVKTDGSDADGTSSDGTVTTNPDVTGTTPTDATTPDGDATGPTGTDADATSTTTSPTDATTNPDVEVVEPPESCDDPIPAAPTGEACGIVPGNSSALLIRANLVLANGIQENGALLIVNGLIACAGCDCLTQPQAADATVFNCPDAVVSPGLINAHDHVTYSQGTPKTHGAVRYDHRNEWRSSGGVTVPGKPKIPGPQNASPLGDSWAELRQVMGGTTSYFASGAAPGLARNLDTASRLEGLSHGAAEYDTFPLGSSGVYSDNCSHYEDPNPNVLQKVAFVPHVAEGVNAGARNEFICLDGQAEGSVDFVTENTAFIHAVGTTSADIAVFVGEGASLVWSPRTNTDLYGFTAFAPIYHRLGGRIALGTDWSYSGSLNMLRELHCAEEWNTRWNHYFTDAQLVNMATTWGAAALGFDDVLGSLTVGKVADIALWDGREHEGLRAILDAEVNDVLLVLRGGTPPTISGTTYYRRGRPLYGDPALVQELSDRQLNYASYDPAVYSATDPNKKKLPEPCEETNVCGVTKRLCVADQLEEKPSGSSFYQTYTLAELKTALTGDTSELFPCNGTTPNEPSCVPARPNEFTGIPSAGDDDGDGIPDAEDNCRGWFNAVRPMDNGHQPDTDSDGVGDVCDPCPLNANTTSCTSLNPDDIDGDGVLNDSDKCPNVADDQTDTDLDGIGDACDACPNESNAAGAACSSTIVKVKTKDTVKVGDPVRLPGVQVVVVGPDFFTVQQVGAADPKNTGLYVFTGAAGTKPVAGQIIELSGTVADYFGQTELTGPSWPTAGITTAPLPAPLVITPADIAVGSANEQAYEALLVEIRDLTVSNTAPTPAVNGTSTENVAGEFDATSGGASVRVDDALYAITPAPVVGQVYGFIRGVLRYNFNRDKLLPRSAADVDAGPPEVASITPASGAMYADTTGGPFVVHLTGPARGTTQVVVTSDDPTTASVTSPITFADGETEKAIVVQAIAQGSVTLTASVSPDGVPKTAHLDIVAAGTIPAVIDADAQSTVTINSDFDVTVTLDLPAPAGGQVITITTSGEVTSCTALTIAAGANEGTSTCTVTGTAGPGSATFSTTSGTATADVTVSDAAPGAEVVFCFEGHVGTADVYVDTPTVAINTTGAPTFAIVGLTGVANFTGAGGATRPAECTLTVNKAPSANGWSVARSDSKYFEFKVNHGAGDYVVSFDVQRSNTGPSTLDVVSSSGLSKTGLVVPIAFADGHISVTGTLSAGDDSIRIYAYGTGTAGAGNLRLDNFQLRPAP